MRLRLPLLLLLGCVAVVMPPSGPIRAEDEAQTGLDYRYFRTTISPMLRRLCGECHADPRKRKKTGRFFLRPAPGRRMRDRFDERNFETVREFLVEEDPAASVILLKALGASRGGVAHEGGGILRENMPEYGQLIDFINGKEDPIPAYRPPVTPEGEPDFLYFVKRIAPVLASVCAECHAGRGKGRMKLIVHPRDEPFPLEDHYANYEMVRRLVKAGAPLDSRFLLKPLAIADGGIKHKGGDRITKAGATYEAWVQFLQGVRGPPLPKEGERRVPLLTAEGLSIQAEEFHFEDTVYDDEMRGAEDLTVARAGEEGGRLHVDLRVVDAGPYRMSFRVAPGTAPLRWWFDEGTRHTRAMPATAELDEHGFGSIGPERLLDGEAPLVDPRGSLVLDGSTLRMDGRQGEAAWLSPSEVRHTGVSATLRMAGEEEGGDDALLLYDMDDGWNGKYVGLTDGGRRFVMGLLEGGVPRVLRALKTPAPKRGQEDAPRQLKVEIFGGVAVASLDQRPLLFVNLSKQLGRGGFGVLTHGRVDVHALAALEEYEVYQVRFAVGPIVDLPAGPLRLWVELPGAGEALDSVRFAVPGG